jgi:RNase P subunit RPR2
MGMENSKFNDLVETLLEPRAKDSLQKKYDHSDHIYKESSIKLAPRGELLPCDDCEDLVRNRVVHYAVYDLARNPHWKKKCLECGKKSVVSHPIKNV